MAYFHGISRNDKRNDLSALPSTSADPNGFRTRVALIKGRWNCVKRLWWPWWRKDEVWKNQ